MKASRPRRRSARERGAVVVEAAMVLPLALILVFGIIDFGLYFKSSLTFADATRAATREGSRSPRSALLTDNVAATMGVQNQIARTDMQNLYVYRVNRSPKPGIPRGLPADASSRDNIAANCGTGHTDCVVYTWNGTTFVKQGGSWPLADQYACAADGPTFVAPGDPGYTGAGPGTQENAATGWNGTTGGLDQVGVYLTGTYNFVTPLGNLLAGGFGTSRPLSALSVMKLEPVPLAVPCYGP